MRHGRARKRVRTRSEILKRRGVGDHPKYNGHIVCAVQSVLELVYSIQGRFSIVHDGSFILPRCTLLMSLIIPIYPSTLTSSAMRICETRKAGQR